MSVTRTSHSARRGCAPASGLLAASIAALIFIAAPTASATPLNFTLVNPSSSNQSRLDLTASAKLAGGELTSSAQFAPGGLNGLGSLSTLYQDTATTDSKILANVNQQSINFTGGSTAVANNTRGAFSDFALKPGVGGASGTAPGDYGVKFSSPQDVVLPPIDVSALGVPGLTTLNIGTLKSIDLNIALRDVVIDVNSGALPFTPTATYPQSFPSNTLTVSISGNSDMLLSAFLVPNSVGDFLTVGAALIGLQQALAPQGVNLTVSTVFFPTAGYNVGFGFTSPLPVTNAVNDDASTGLLEHVGSKLRLTLPIKFDVVPTTLPAPLDTLLTATLGLSGKLVGETNFVVVAVPEPSTIALGTFGLVGLAAVAWRRRRATSR